MSSLHDTLDPHETLASEEAHEHHVHVTPFWPMLWVFVTLLVLTGLTVWSSNIHGFWIGNTHIELGATAHILMAMVIAVVKAVLVAAYFMHLKYDNPMNTAVLSATIFAVILFIGFTLADSTTRHVTDRMQHAKIIPGGTSHLNPDGTYNKGLGVTAAARANAKAAGHGDGHTEDGHATDAHAQEKPKESGGH